MDKYTNKQIISAIKSLKNKVNKKFKLEKTILFGSRIRNDNLLTSDVDLILVSKDFEKIQFRKRMSEILEYWNKDVDLEVLCYTPEEFKRKSKQLGIVQQAIKEGKEI